MKAMKGMKGTEERRSPKAARLLIVAATLLAVLLAAAAGYTAARYVTESDATLSAVVEAFEVTSAITYTDEWGTAQAFDGNLGTMVIPSGGICFTMTITNESDMEINCTIELNGGYRFTDSYSFSVDGVEVSFTDDYGTLTFGPIEAKSGDVPGTATATFYVVRDDGSWFPPTVEGDEGQVASAYEGAGVYSRNLEMTVTYTQAV